MVLRVSLGLLLFEVFDRSIAFDLDGNLYTQHQDVIEISAMAQKDVFIL